MRAVPPFLALLALAPAASQEAKPRFSKRDHERVADDVAKWIEAKMEKQSASRILADIEKRLAEAAKRAKIDDPLSSVRDLEVILGGTLSYRKTGFVTGNESTRDTVSPSGEKMRYGLRLPKRYEPDKVAYPLLVSIPGPGEDPKNHLASVWKHDELRDGAILYAPEIPKDLEGWTDVEGRNVVFSGIPDVWGTFHVDRNRIFFAGQGEAGVLALRLATWFPDRVAGVVLFQAPETKVVLENLRNVPVLLAGEGPGSKAIATRLNDLGYAVEEKGEDIEGVAAWILARHRNAYPEETVFFPARRFAKNAHWVRIDEYDSGGVEDVLELSPERRPMLRGKIDRSKNEITFETRGIHSFDVLLNDVLVDLEKPIQVVLNGQSWSGTYERSLEFLLDMVFLRNDPSTVYVASHACRVAQEPEGRSPGEASGSKAGGESGSSPK